MANQRGANEPVFIRPAGFSSDEDATSDEEGFSFGDSVKNNAPKTDFSRSNEISKIEPVSDAEAICIEAATGNVEKMQLLFEKSNLPTDVISQGSTPLMSAASNCEYKTLSFLLEKGADANFSRRDFTVLMNACSCNRKNEEEQLKCIQLLIEYGSNVNSRQRNGMTPLMIACREGKEKIVAELIQAKANINEKDCMGWTPLIWCVRHSSPGQMNTLDVLLEAGADSSITCGRCQTAHDHALNLGYKHIAARIPIANREQLPVLSDIPVKTDAWTDLKENLEDTNKHWNLWQDVARCLHQLGLFKIYGQNFKNKNIDLVKFLTLTEDELEDMAIIPLHRKRLLDTTRKLHLKRWQEKSLGVRSIRNIQDSYNMVDEIKLIANLARQITMIHASIAYIRIHLDKICPEPEDSFKADDLNHNIEIALKKAKVLHIVFQSYLNYIKTNVGDVKYPPDYIQLETKKSHKRFILVIVTLSVVGIVAWKTHH